MHCPQNLSFLAGKGLDDDGDDNDDNDEDHHHKHENTTVTPTKKKTRVNRPVVCINNGNFLHHEQTTRGIDKCR